MLVSSSATGVAPTSNVMYEARDLFKSLPRTRTRCPEL